MSSIALVGGGIIFLTAGVHSMFNHKRKRSNASQTVSASKEEISDYDSAVSYEHGSVFDPYSEIYSKGYSSAYKDGPNPIFEGENEEDSNIPVDAGLVYNMLPPRNTTLSGYDWATMSRDKSQSSEELWGKEDPRASMINNKMPTTWYMARCNNAINGPNSVLDRTLVPRWDDKLPNEGGNPDDGFGFTTRDFNIHNRNAMNFGVATTTRNLNMPMIKTFPLFNRTNGGMPGRLFEKAFGNKFPGYYQETFGVPSNTHPTTSDRMGPDGYSKRGLSKSLITPAWSTPVRTGGKYGGIDANPNLYQRQNTYGEVGAVSGVPTAPGFLVHKMTGSEVYRLSHARGRVQPQNIAAGMHGAHDYGTPVQPSKTGRQELYNASECVVPNAGARYGVAVGNKSAYKKSLYTAMPRMDADKDVTKKSKFTVTEAKELVDTGFVDLKL